MKCNLVEASKHCGETYYQHYHNDVVFEVMTQCSLVRGYHMLLTLQEEPQ